MNQIIIDTTMNQKVKNLISYPKVDNSLKDTKLTLLSWDNVRISPCIMVHTYFKTIFGYDG